MKYFVVYTILLSFLLMSCASQPANAQSGDEPVFSISAKNQNDQVNFQYVDGTAIVDIQSPTGIGSAKLELESGGMPENMLLRLHLQGLEEIRLISKQAVIVASGSSSGSFVINEQRVNSSGSEYSLTPIDPLWMKIEIISDQLAKKIPLEEGYFEIIVPREFLRNAGNSFEIQWIDFYR
jgi:hypothetical protein